jgi:hypothetical protein
MAAISKPHARFIWREIVLVVLEVILVIGAGAGGIALMARPESGLGMGVNSLSKSPFSNFLIPGIVLFVANSLLPLAVVVVVLMRVRWSHLGHVAVGAALLIWIVVEMIWIAYNWLQPAFGVMAVLILGFAIWNWTRRTRGGAPA